MLYLKLGLNELVPVVSEPFASLTLEGLDVFPMDETPQ
jgi:hypothetical protein